MTDIECPIADLEAILSQYPERVQMYIVAWKFAQLISPHATPKSILTQLGEKCPEDSDECRGAGPVVHAERVPVAIHAICPGSGRRRPVQGASPQAAVDPSGAAHRDGEAVEEGA